MVVAQQEVRETEVHLTKGGEDTFEAVDVTFHEGALQITLASGGMVVYAPGSWVSVDVFPPHTVRTFS